MEYFFASKYTSTLYSVSVCSMTNTGRVYKEGCLLLEILLWIFHYFKYSSLDLLSVDLPLSIIMPKLPSLRISQVLYNLSISFYYRFCFFKILLQHFLPVENFLYLCCNANQWVPLSVLSILVYLSYFVLGNLIR